MTYTTIELPLVGPTSQNRAKQFSSAFTKNFYIEVTESGDTILHPFLGTKIFSDKVTSGPDRGSHVLKGQLYTVTGSILELIKEDGSRTNLGTIAGLMRCVFADDGQDLMITAGGKVYKFDTSLNEQTDVDFENPHTVAYLNSRFIFDGNLNRFGVSEVLDGGNIDALNYGSADSAPDDIVRAYAFDQKLYLYCERTIEPHYNTDTGNPPYQRIDTGIMQKGLRAIYSVSNTDLFMYFVGDDRQVYQLKGSSVQHISTPALDHEIQGFNKTEDAVGFCFTMQGQDWYFLTFPSANVTFLYSETTNLWVKLSFGVNNDRHIAGSYQFAYGKHLVTDHADGTVYEWDIDTYTDDSQVIQRQRILPVISGERIKAPGQRLQMSRIELLMERGVGNTDQSDPVVMVDVSMDGGRSWENIKYLNVGQAGEFLTKVEYYHVESFYEATVRITTSDPNFFSIRAAAIDIRTAGY